MEKLNVLDLNLDELIDRLKSYNIEKFRAKQIYQAMYSGVDKIEEITTLSKDLRERLSEHLYISPLEIVEKYISKLDGTTKFLFKLNDENFIESVLMKYKHGNTICISTQVGCKMGCKFCASTIAGFRRNLTPGEMIAQILNVQKLSNVKISNIVMMGIGEPLDNYENTIKFLRLVNSHEGLNIGMRHISLSTSGLIPQIEKLIDENLQITLSISLHAPSNEIRKKIMPIANKYSIEELLKVCKKYTRTTKRRITYEYALIDGINDSKEDAMLLSKILKGQLCHVNLIPVNKIKESSLKKSKNQNINEFNKILNENGINSTIRRELGNDIDAACGQLRSNIISQQNNFIKF